METDEKLIKIKSNMKKCMTNIDTYIKSIEQMDDYLGCKGLSSLYGLEDELINKYNIKIDKFMKQLGHDKSGMKKCVETQTQALCDQTGFFEYAVDKIQNCSTDTDIWKKLSNNKNPDQQPGSTTLDDDKAKDTCLWREAFPAHVYDCEKAGCCFIPGGDNHTRLHKRIKLSDALLEVLN